MKRITSLIVLICFGFLLWNCSEDEQLEHENIEIEQPHIHTHKIPWDQISDTARIRTQLIRIKENMALSAYNEGYVSNRTNESGYNPLLGLNLLSSEVEYTTYVGGHSYTFATYRDIDNGMIENIVLISQEDGTYKEFLMQYDLTEEEYNNIGNGNPLNSSLMDKTNAIPLENGSYNSIISNSFPDDNCTETWTLISEALPCNCSVHGQDQANNSACYCYDEPVEYKTYWLYEEDCSDSSSGGSGGSEDDLPPNPWLEGAGGGSGGGGTGTGNSSGNGDGETNGSSDGNQHQDAVIELGFTKPFKGEVDQRLIISQKLNDAFGEGNWEHDDSITEDNANYVVDDISEMNDISENVTFTDVSTQVEEINANEIIITKTVRLDDGMTNHVYVDISCNYNLETKEVSNVTSDISGFIFAFGWTHISDGNMIFEDDNPNTEYDETVIQLEVLGYWHYSIFWNGIGTVIKSKYWLSFMFDAEGNTTPIIYDKMD